MRRKKDPNIVVLTGAGLSAESGIPTFRGMGGMWETHNIREVATPDAFDRNPALVHRFYNERRTQCQLAQPNRAHYALAKLTQQRDVALITQNIDDLLERAGCEEVTHLHGHIGYARSTEDYDLLVPVEGDLSAEDRAPDGAPLRPHVVWFGEVVHALPYAIEVFSSADVVLVIGTSLQVFPANTLLSHAPTHASIYVIDPKRPEGLPEHAIWWQMTATEGVPAWVREYG